MAGTAVWVIKKQITPTPTNSQETVTVQKRDLTKTVTATGYVVPEQTDQLAFLINGKTTAINKQVGDVVNKDEVLIEIDGGSGARHSDEQLKAPFDGKILAVATFVDDTIAAGTPVITIGYRTNVIEFIASEVEIFDLAVGQVSYLTIPGYDDGATAYQGVIEFIDPVKKDATASATATAGTLGGSTNQETGFAIKIRPIDVPTEALALIGLTVDVEVVVAETTAALSLERAAIQYDDADQPFVYLPTEQTEAIVQEITLGFEGDEYVEIVSGLNEADSVVLYIPSSDAITPF